MPIIDQLGNRRSGLGGRLQVRDQVRAKRVQRIEAPDVIPRRWKVIQTVWEKFSCRDCEKISQRPVPFHATPRGWAGPKLLATILFEKCGAHQPLNRQSERYGRVGVGS